jgi:hypothetical protein
MVHILQILSDVVITNPGLPEVQATSDTIGKILVVVLNVMGAVTLLIITLGGLKYVLSRGEPQGTNRAKDTILYALIGLVIIIFARALVAFVFNKVG